jgi:AcrR family transcriptional regulator
MSISYEQSGRRNQKARTRAALVSVARDLLEEGTTPTVEDVAAAASVSRATAYRYFPNQQALLVAAHPEVETTSLMGADASDDPAERLDRAVVGLAEIIIEAEPSYRTMLRLSLEDDADDRGELALRRGRRYLWLEDALAPLQDRLRPDEWARLVHGVAAVAGIEALVTLVDLGKLSRERALDVMRWAAQALLEAALAEADEVRA